MPLTMENSGAALVAGAPLRSKSRRVRVLRPFMVDGGQAVAADDEVTLSATFAAEMVGAGKAVYAAEPAEPAESATPAPPPAAKPQKPVKEQRNAGQ
jgi:hypothetical protein